MTEAEFSAGVADRLSDVFTLTPQVWMTHWSGEKIRIDFAAIPKTETIPVGVYGFECKKTGKAFNDRTSALAQCVDYKQSIISDVRMESFDGTPLKFVFLVAPDPWEGVVGAPYGKWLDPDSWNGGTLRLAGKFGVGIASKREPWDGLCLYVGAEKWWSEKQGLRGNGESWMISRTIGSNR